MLRAAALGQLQRGRPRVRRLDGHHLALDDPQPHSRTVEGIALGHQMPGQ